MGNATTDGRPFSWKNRDGVGRHFLWYVSGGPYNYLAMGNSEGLKMGVNAAGLSVQNSELDDIPSPGYTLGNNTAFKAYFLSSVGNVAEARQAIIEDTTGAIDHWPPPSIAAHFSDARGHASTYEVGANIYYEYDPNNPVRLLQFPKQFVVRANNSHKNSDQTDDPTTGGNRYVVARNDMQYWADNGGLNVWNWINNISRHGEPDIDAVEMPSNSSTVGVMLVHGVNEGEDPRIVTSWIALGNPDYACFIPAWVAQGNNLYPRVMTSDPIDSFAGLSEQLSMKHDAYQYDQYINNLIRPLEDNIIEAVAAARARWLASGFKLDEATRIHMEASDSAWNMMKSMAAGSGRALNMTPRLTSIIEMISGSQVAFNCEAIDDDGAIAAYEWDFGDGSYSTSPAPVHIYNSVGTYLVRCRIVDNNGSRNSKWKYVAVSQGNQAPAVTINAPSDGAGFTEGQSISFSGFASDAEDGDLTAHLTWTSNLSGNIGTGGSFTRLDLAPGTHTITAAATDSGGVSRSAQISIVISIVGGGTSILEVRVAAGSDDAEEAAAGSMYLNSSDIELVNDDPNGLGNQTVGIRFNGILIPRGAAILNAYVQFKTDETGSAATSLTICGENIDNAGAFSSSARNISARQRTTASVAWSPVAWTVVGEAGVNQRTPDISPVIQMIVDRSGWTSGNSLVIIIRGTGRRTAEAFEEDPPGASLLHIEYSTAPVNQAPVVVVSTPANGSSFIAGQPISFSGSASDVQDGNLTTVLTWTSSLNGTIGTGGSFSRSNLASGAHTISASVTDSGGRTGKTEILLTVNAVSQVVVRGPYLQSGTPNSIVVRWRTSASTNSQVRYGLSPENLNLVADDPVLRTEHEIKLSGLNPATQYFYSIGTSAEVLGGGSSCYFVTAPLPGSAKKSRIWVVSDADEVLGNQYQVRDAYYAFTGDVHTDLWMLLGDDSEGGTDPDMQLHVFDCFQSMLRKSVVWSCFGNRDQYVSKSPTQTGPYYDSFTFPKNGEAGGYPSGTEAYYSFDFANIHFVCLNSVDSYPYGPMLTWLQHDLASNTQSWVIAFWHHPPYSKGIRDSDIDEYMKGMRANVVPVLENYGVDLVLGAHSHSYERSFLLDGHYGLSSTLTSSMILDNGSGRVDGDGAYMKPTNAMTPHQGAVYMVASTLSSYCSPCTLNHPAMYFSSTALGSAILDVDGNRIDVRFLDRLGVTRDYFTIIKGGGSPQPPAVPGNLAATADGQSSVSLTWQDNSADEGGFYVERKTGTGSFGQIATLGPNVTAYSDTALTSNTTYSYRVQAYKGTLTSDYSNEASATTSSGNQAPTVTITAPATGSSFNAGQSISFSGTAADPEDGNVAASISWTSSRDGAIGTGGSFSKSNLSVGVHTITAAVTDTGGLSGQAQIALTVNAVNQAPTVTITAPATGSSYGVGQSISFSGTASDPENGNLAASLSWTSSRDGVIGTGGSFARSNLSVGVHTITAAVTDSGGLSGQAQIVLTVNAVNQAPTVTITAPATGSSYNPGQPISFSGSAFDAEDGNLSASLSWTSNRDGAIGTGGSFSRSNLSVGVHTITAAITDSWGLSGQALIALTVNAVSSLEVRVAAGSDDAEEAASGSMSLSSSDIELVNDDSTGAGNQTVGIRFNGINIPRGAAILNAYVQFKVDETGSGATSLTICGENIDNAGAFISSARNISARQRTTASVAWSPAAWTVVGEAGVNQRTPDIAPVIQMIVDRSGWTSGNPLVIIIRGTGRRTAEAFEEDRPGASLLHIDYSAVPVNRAPAVVISTPADGSSFIAGQSISFSGNATDYEDGDLTAGLTWTSSLEGNIGTGGVFSRTNLRAGVHTITASITDGGGQSRSSQISIIVYQGATEVRVAAGSDDAEEAASGSMSLSSSDIELVNDDSTGAGNQTVGIRFNGINIPRGATILRAYVQFKVDETGSGATSLTICGENIDNAGAFLSSARNVSARQRTTASVVWSPAAWTVVGEAGVNQRTPDIAPVIQEIVVRSGWTSGNSLVIIIRGTGRRTAEAFEEDRPGASLLHIEYSTGPGG